MTVDAELMKILVCPSCRAKVDLRQESGGEVIVCSGCGLRYPVRDDIPVMLIEEAERPA